MSRSLRSSGGALALLALLALLSAVGLAVPAARAQAPPGSTHDSAPCRDGRAAGFACHGVDLLALVPLAGLAAPDGVASLSVSDHWGWTDPASGREFVLVGRSRAPAFVEITDPERPLLLGHLGGGGSRDMKTAGHHAFFVGGEGGLRVFDLRRLLDVAAAPARFDPDAHYTGFGSAHNLAVNEASGFAYAVGGGGADYACGGGLFMIDVRDPLHPQPAGCFGDLGYVHDVQCVLYDGPDEDHRGREVCLASVPGAGLGVVDVTDKAAPAVLASRDYPNERIAHQGWLTADHRYFLMGDEGDEDGRAGTRTLVWDVRDLDDPALAATYAGRTPAVDHNQYVDGRYLFQANYTAGLSVLALHDLPDLREVAFFDTVPSETARLFDGAWTAYPFFPSGTVTVTSRLEGLFVLRPTGLDRRASTAVDEAPGPVRSAALSVFPNPTRGDVRAVLLVPAAGPVRVDLYDTLGRHVARLHDGEAHPDAPLRLRLGVGEAGRRLAPGLYHLRAAGASFRLSAVVVVVE